MLCPQLSHQLQSWRDHGGLQYLASLPDLKHLLQGLVLPVRRLLTVKPAWDSITQWVCSVIAAASRP